MLIGISLLAFLIIAASASFAHEDEAEHYELPPGLQKQLKRKGQLPPGLQKRLEPFPRDLEVRLPRVSEIGRGVILGRHVLLLDRRTERILDIIEDVVGLATGR